MITFNIDHKSQLLKGFVELFPNCDGTTWRWQSANEQYMAVTKMHYKTGARLKYGCKSEWSLSEFLLLEDNLNEADSENSRIIFTTNAKREGILLWIQFNPF